MDTLAAPVSVGARIQLSRRERGLTQEDLARRADVAYTTLTKIESGKIRNPSFEVLTRLSAALGTSLDDLHLVAIYRAEHALERIWADILATLPAGETMYISGIDESRYLRANKAGIRRFIADIKRAGLRQKLLSCEGDTVRLKGDHLEYRWVPKEYFNSTPLYVYGDKVATVVWEPSPQSIILTNPALADTFRRQFVFMWDHAIVPGAGSSGERKGGSSVGAGSARGGKRRKR
jgi:transcriptional regulator with XRE-family HTH domain